MVEYGAEKIKFSARESGQRYSISKWLNRTFGYEQVPFQNAYLLPEVFLLDCGFIL